MKQNPGELILPKKILKKNGLLDNNVVQAVVDTMYVSYGYNMKHFVFRSRREEFLGNNFSESFYDNNDWSIDGNYENNKPRNRTLYSGWNCILLNEDAIQFYGFFGVYNNRGQSLGVAKISFCVSYDGKKPIVSGGCFDNYSYGRFYITTQESKQSNKVLSCVA
jgi:hypothetical protein